ncbi:MAG: hypothetical protein E5Y02_13005 [Mesorhizobium sp.]|nr:MAG: hypothetical protein E5Y02_13005 [Mesorhizobium sp.]
MTASIYYIVKRKLISHGVKNFTDGKLTIVNKRLFLDFVQLERAIRKSDFDAVHSAVEAIDHRALSMGKRHLVLFAYMYARFSDGTPELTHSDVPLEGGGVRRTLDYRCTVSPTDRLIGDWAAVWYDQYSSSFFRALHQSNKSFPDHGPSSNGYVCRRS